MRRLHDKQSHKSLFARHNRKTWGNISLFGGGAAQPQQDAQEVPVTAAVPNGPSAEYAPSHAPARLIMPDACHASPIRKGR